MNSSSILTLNNKYIHVVYISIIASLLLGTALAPSLLRAAAQDDDARVLEVLCNSYGEGVDVSREGRSERISFGEWLADQRPGLVDLFSEVGCAGISASVSGGIVSGTFGARVLVPCNDPDIECIQDHFIDVDGDGVDDLRITTRTIVATLTGDMNGRRISIQQITQDLETNIATAVAMGEFFGTIGDSEPGAFREIITLLSDRSQAPEFFQFSGTSSVVAGSGTGGLKGICGATTLEGSGPPFVTVNSFDFAFGAACEGFEPFGE